MVFVASLALEKKLMGPYTLPLLCSEIFCSVSSVPSGKDCLFVVAMCCRYSMHCVILPPLASHRGDSVNKLCNKQKHFILRLQDRLYEVIEYDIMNYT